MTQETRTTFSCDGCGIERMGESHIIAPHGWRELSWRGGYQGDEKREAHFCGRCCDSRLKALDVLLGPLAGRSTKVKR